MSATSDLLETLRRHYIPEAGDMHARPGGVFAHEVAVNGTWGAAGNRRVDAVYAGFTSASGRILIGHELKVSRSDWRAELAKVGKADAWADACHAWYIVAPSTEVVPPEELPAGWGLMLPPRSSRGRRMQIAVKAEVKTDHAPPWWAVRSIMARLDTLEHDARAPEIARVVKAEVEKRVKWYESSRRPVESMSLEDRARLTRLEQLEQELGFTITSYRSSLEDHKISVRDLERALRMAAATTDQVSTAQVLERDVPMLRRLADELEAVIPAALALNDGQTKQEGPW